MRARVDPEGQALELVEGGQVELLFGGPAVGQLLVEDRPVRAGSREPPQRGVDLPGRAVEGGAVLRQDGAHQPPFWIQLVARLEGRQDGRGQPVGGHGLRSEPARIPEHLRRRPGEAVTAGLSGARGGGDTRGGPVAEQPGRAGVLALAVPAGVEHLERLAVGEQVGQQQRADRLADGAPRARGAEAIRRSFWHRRGSQLLEAVAIPGHPGAERRLQVALATVPGHGVPRLVELRQCRRQASRQQVDEDGVPRIGVHASTPRRMRLEDATGRFEPPLAQANAGQRRRIAEIQRELLDTGVVPSVVELLEVVAVGVSRDQRFGLSPTAGRQQRLDHGVDLAEVPAELGELNRTLHLRALRQLGQELVEQVGARLLMTGGQERPGVPLLPHGPCAEARVRGDPREQTQGCAGQQCDPARRAHARRTGGDEDDRRLLRW